MFVFLEGATDERFFERVLMERFKKKYETVKIIKFSGLTKDRIREQMRIIESTGKNYIVLGDFDIRPHA